MYTWVGTCSCLCSNTCRILTINMFHHSLKLHQKHYTPINFRRLQATLLWKWCSFRNCVLPLNCRRESFETEESNGEDSKKSGRASKSLYSEMCLLHHRGVVTSPLLHSADHVYKYGGQRGRLSKAQPSHLPCSPTFPPACREQPAHVPLESVLNYSR